MKKTKQPKEVYLQRIKCNCVAQKHELINNCLGCGKVVCAQEGEGPCLYCGNIVTKPDGKFIINDESLFPSLSKEELSKLSQERSKAIGHKNVLLERDRSTTQIQNIFDENIDYYDASENQWLDEESRQNAIDQLLAKEKKVEKEQFQHKIVFDPVSGKFVNQSFEFDEDSFKQEGKKFVMEKEKEEYVKKMEKAKENWDSRMLKNDKVQEIVSELRREVVKPQKELPKVVPKKAITDLLIEEEETTPENS